jgi:hypothetical protein
VSLQGVSANKSKDQHRHMAQQKTRETTAVDVSACCGRVGAGVGARVCDGVVADRTERTDHMKRREHVARGVCSLGLCTDSIRQTDTLWT